MQVAYAAKYYLGLPHNRKSLACSAPTDKYLWRFRTGKSGRRHDEELITELSRIGSLKVVSRTSVMQYKGEKKKPLPQIGPRTNRALAHA
jgi:hypothetical protein